MSRKPAASSWAADLSDDYDDDYDDSRRLLNGPVDNYQSTEEKAIRRHEEGLNRLGEAIKRQKYVANEIATEVDVHNEILNDLDTGLGNASDNLRKNTRNINLISQKSSLWFLWFLIIVLAGVIVTLAII